MPIYEYKCANCSRVFEAIQKFTDEPLTECRFCQGPVERLISNSSFQLKGSGWYVTDYARKSSGGKTSADSDATKSDAKSDAKSDGKTGSSGDKADAPAKSSPAKPADSGGSKGTSDS